MQLNMNYSSSIMIYGFLKLCQGPLPPQGKQCLPAKSLKGKPFSSEFWKGQLRYLCDAVKQFEFRQLFITKSPSEWLFSLPPWLKQLQKLIGLGESDLSAYETIHFFNTLQQIVKSHLFSCRRKSSINVANYFYFFEFQETGTVHMHLLVWLNNLTQIDLHYIQGDIPWADVDFTYLIYNLQSSDKGSLNIDEEDTTVETKNGVARINICHPTDAFA